MDATLEEGGGGYTLSVERRLAHTPERVWRALTEGELLEQWFPCAVLGEWRVGAELRFVFPPGEVEDLSPEDLRGEVLAVDQPRLLEFRWGRHVLKYELTADGDGCLFRLTESFDDASWGARNAAGWEMCLENLDLILDGVAAVKFVAGVWRAKFDRYAKKFESTVGPNGGLPEDHPLLALQADGEAD